MLAFLCYGDAIQSQLTMRKDNETYKYLIYFQTGCPFLKSDSVVPVAVTFVQEWGDAVLQSHKWSTYRKYLMTRNSSEMIPNKWQKKNYYHVFFQVSLNRGYLPVMTLIELTKLPDGRESPSLSNISFRLTLHFEVVGGQFISICSVSHYVKKPIPHSPRKVSHLAWGALLKNE